MDFWSNQDYRENFLIAMVAIVLWSLPWKALALWKSARNSHKWWFLAFMILNTLGLLEIFYVVILPKFKKKRVGR